MLSISELGRFYYLRNFHDMRCKYGRDLSVIHQQMDREPRSGEVYIMMSKDMQTVRLYSYERHSCSLYEKRFEKGYKFMKVSHDALGIDWKIPTEHANLSEGVRREGNAHPWAQYQLRAGQRVNVNLQCDAWTTHTQSKLVRCVKGAVLDVAVDIRKGSPTFGQHISCLLTGRDDEGMKIAEQWEKEFLIPHP